MKATELAESAKAAGRKVEDAALECGNFAAANAKLKEELKDSDAAEVLRKVPLYLLRLQAAQQTSEAYVQATVACEKDMRRREGFKREEEKRSALFRSFDKDGDGRLQEAEALLLAKALLSQTEPSASKVSEKSLKEIVRAALEEDGTVQSLSLLSTCVGSFREMQRDGRRRLAREARAKLFGSLQSKWRRRVQELEASAGIELEDTLKEVEAAVAPLLTETSSLGPPGQMQTRSKHCETLIQKGQEKAEDFQKKVQQLPESFRNDVNSKQVQASELEDLMAPHQKRLALRLGRTGQRLERAKRLTELFRAKVARKENDAMEVARGKLSEALRAYAKSQSFSAKQLFDSISDSSDSDSEMTEKAFLELCGKAEAEDTELASKVFHRALPEDAETLSLSAFEHLLRSFYKVTQQTPFTEEAEVSGGNAKVQLQSGEFLEALESDPKEVDEVGERLRLRSRDGSEGWATLSHLRPVPLPAYALKRRAPLLEAKDLKSESKEPLLEGDVVELFKEEEEELLEEEKDQKEPKDQKEQKEPKLKVVFGSVQTRSGKYGWIPHSDQVLQPI